MIPFNVVIGVSTIKLEERKRNLGSVLILAAYILPIHEKCKGGYFVRSIDFFNKKVQLILKSGFY